MVAIKGIVGTLGELFHFLWTRRLWWLTPVMLVLLLFAAVAFLGGTPGVGPFIYTLF